MNDQEQERLNQFNTATQANALKEISHWCAGPNWAEAVCSERPYASINELAAKAGDLWLLADEADCLKAFAAHPVIGDVELLRSKYATQANVEQGQVLAAADEVIEELAVQNLKYSSRHGFTFIVFATGKSASEMLELLNMRIDNSRKQEIQNAKMEQLKILQLRLKQSFESTSPAANQNLEEMSEKTMPKDEGPFQATLSSHVLDLDAGSPAQGLSIALHKLDDNGDRLALLHESVTDSDGRAADWPQLEQGHYELCFEAGAWYRAQAADSFYPRVRIEFNVPSERHYHVPLLLNRFGFSSYRGS